MVPGRVSTGPPLIVGFAAFPRAFSHTNNQVRRVLIERQPISSPLQERFLYFFLGLTATYIYHAIPKEHRWNLGRVGPEVGRVPFVSMTDNKPTLLLSNANTNRNGRCS